MRTNIMRARTGVNPSKGLGVDGWSVIEGEIEEGKEGISEGGKEIERERGGEGGRDGGSKGVR